MNNRLSSSHVLFGILVALSTPILINFIRNNYILSNFRLLYYPAQYHGNHISSDYFEGWYFKLVSEDKTASLAVIPGIFKGNIGYKSIRKENSKSDADNYHKHNDYSLDDSHAFVLLINRGHECLYYRYDVNEFKSVNTKEKDAFQITIGHNHFRHDEMVLSLPSSHLWQPTDSEYETFLSSVMTDYRRLLPAENNTTELEVVRHPHIPYSIRGVIAFENVTPLKSTMTIPSVMGIFQYIPWLECFHQIISLDHIVHGEITFINDKFVETSIDLENGRGYIEKDWGINFPKTWIWAQSNNFIKEAGNSILVSKPVGINSGLGHILLFDSPYQPMLPLPIQISIAEVPLVQSFYHIAGALIVVHHSSTNVTYNFSTYKLPHRHSLKVTLDPTTHIQNVYLHVSDRDNNHLEVNVWRKAGTGVPLRAPNKEHKKMILTVEENLDAEMTVKMWNGNEGGDVEVIMDDTAVSAGLEIVGDVVKLGKEYAG
ncbi:2422_t:CDS:1 [Paraglomus brasilianum]|uniref:2422_t:CDS:1 n=1 Tax=Paraglomus brasilianum TaxID=144538 RepID=A0A9N9FD80_9GLOM|nr:2422_t:CDS:1 [Paraglomus brasilianum]